MKITPAPHRKPLYPRLLLYASTVGAVGAAAALLIRHGSEIQLIDCEAEVQAEQHTLGFICQAEVESEQQENSPTQQEKQESQPEEIPLSF